MHCDASLNDVKTSNDANNMQQACMWYMSLWHWCELPVAMQDSALLASLLQLQLCLVMLQAMCSASLLQLQLCLVMLASNVQC